MDKQVQRLIGFIKGNFGIIFLGFILGALTTSLFWQSKLDNNKSLLNSQNLEIASLQEQIKVLKTLPSPIPQPILYVQKENLSPENIYKLTCFNRDEIESQKPNFDWIEKMINKLPKESSLITLCYNKEQNQAIVMSSLTGTQRSYPIELSLYFIPESSLVVINGTFGSYLSSCEKIIAWTKTDSIYYQCNAGDAGWGTSSVYRINFSSLSSIKVGVTESCRSADKKTFCTKYCQSNSDCQQGSFCNQENNSCVKSCVAKEDCISAGEICKPYGTLMGCANK